MAPGHRDHGEAQPLCRRVGWPVIGPGSGPSFPTIYIARQPLTWVRTRPKREGRFPTRLDSRICPRSSHAPPRPPRTYGFDKRYQPVHPEGCQNQDSFTLQRPRTRESIRRGYCGEQQSISDRRPKGFVVHWAWRGRFLDVVWLCCNASRRDGGSARGVFVREPASSQGTRSAPCGPIVRRRR